MLRRLPDGPPLGDADLLGGPQALLDHHLLLEEGDDRSLTFLSDRDRCFHPAVDRHPFHLDLLGGQGLVDDLLVLTDKGPDAHAASELLPLEDDGTLLDHGDDLAVMLELPCHSGHHLLSGASGCSLHLAAADTGQAWRQPCDRLDVAARATRHPLDVAAEELVLSLERLAPGPGTGQGLQHLDIGLRLLIEKPSNELAELARRLAR